MRLIASLGIDVYAIHGIHVGVVGADVVVDVVLNVFAQAKDVPSKTAATRGPSDKAIAATKARGLVWVGKNKQSDFANSARH